MKNICFIIVCLVSFASARAQYISNCQLPDNDCPTVCPGSSLGLEVYNVQNLNSGDTLQAWLSNASGSFSSGTTTLASTAYSLNAGASWTPGPFLFSSNVTDLYFQITIPANLPAGSGYLLKMKSSSGYVSGESFTCSGAGNITVTAAYPTLATQAAGIAGSNQWIGDVYTWTAVDSTLTGAAFTDAQNFYDSANYQGYFLEDSINFNINYLAASGGTCPGEPGVLNNGTSIPCYEGWGDDFSIRLLRTEDFAPGMYQFTIQGDDGIRFSIDGGNTWLLSSFVLQIFDTSLQSTAANYPNGICMSGPTNLVIEYFQHLVDAQLAFTATLLSGTAMSNAGNQSTCPGGNVNFNLSGAGNYTYQWYYSTNNGATFNPVGNTAPFSGASTSNLTVSNVPSSYNNYLFYCTITGLCSNAVNTPTDTLFVNGAGGASVSNPGNQTACDGGSVSFNLSGPDSLAYQWYYSANGGTFTPVTNNSTFSGASTTDLIVNNVQSADNNYVFYCSVSGLCGNAVNTPADTLFVGGTGQPAQISTGTPNICPSDSATICVTSGGTAYSWSTGQTTECITTSYPGNYYVTVTYSGGCSATSNHVTINVYPSPSVSITQSGDTLRVYSDSICQWYNGVNAIGGATDSIYIANGPGSYTVLITDTNGCTAASNPIQIGPAGLKEIAAAGGFYIYPNPLTGSCIISVSNPAKGPLMVFDALGRLILQKEINATNTELDMGALAPGVYMFRLGDLVKKLIKE